MKKFLILSSFLVLGVISNASAGTFMPVRDTVKMAKSLMEEGYDVKFSCHSGFCCGSTGYHQSSDDLYPIIYFDEFNEEYYKDCENNRPEMEFDRDVFPPKNQKKAAPFFAEDPEPINTKPQMPFNIVISK